MQVFVPRRVNMLQSRNQVPGNPWTMWRNAQLPSQLREHLVRFAAVAMQAGGHEVFPSVLPAPAARDHVVNRIGCFAAIGAGEGVPTQNAPTGDMLHVPVGASYIAIQHDDSWPR